MNPGRVDRSAHRRPVSGCPGLLLVLLVALAGVWDESEVQAHTRSVSYAAWSMDGRSASVRLQLAALDLNGLEAAAAQRGEALATLLQREVTASVGEAPCTVEAGTFRRLRAEEGAARFAWASSCPVVPSDGVRLAGGGLFDVLQGHLQVVSVSWQGDQGEEVLLTGRRRATVVMKQGGVSRQGWWVYVESGARHLLVGWDHLIFLLCLVLAAARLRDVVLMVTGFTAGHGVATAVVVFGAVEFEPDAVEVLIAGSIVVLAVENVWLAGSRRDRWLPVAGTGGVLLLGAAALAMGLGEALLGLGVFAGFWFAHMRESVSVIAHRWAATAVFGVVHGLGFAGALGAFQVDEGERWRWLVGFNLGVEFGQVLVVLVGWLLLVGLKRWFEGRKVVEVGSALAVGAGVFWLVERVLG